jgi:hypothetical protein
MSEEHTSRLARQHPVRRLFTKSTRGPENRRALASKRRHSEFSPRHKPRVRLPTEGYGEASEPHLHKWWTPLHPLSLSFEARPKRTPFPSDQIRLLSLVLFCIAAPL